MAHRKNVVRVWAGWYVACHSRALPSDKPIARTILGVPLVLFRDKQGAPAAMLDRCPHRNVPLSEGTIQDGELVCRYHGWRFDGAGKLQAIPGLAIVDDDSAGARDFDMPGRRATSYACMEKDGCIWVWMEKAVQPTTQPFDLPQAKWDGYLTVRHSVPINATLHSVLENILDVPHTAFLHGGLFRQEKKKNEITAIVRRGREGVEAEFLGEPRPEGIAARILSPSGGVVEHFDRFVLPSIAQVEYRLGADTHLLTTTMCTPVTETHTIMHVILSVRARLPMTLLAPVIAPFAWRIIKQDKDILEAQTHTVDAFGTETFSSTAIDLLGPHILHLLKKAEAGALDDAIVREERVMLRV